MKRVLLTLEELRRVSVDMVSHYDLLELEHWSEPLRDRVVPLLMEYGTQKRGIFRDK